MILKKLLYRIRGYQDLNKLIKQGLKVGEKCNILPGSQIDSSFPYLISIGNNVTITPGVLILAHDGSTKNKLGYSKIGKVFIGNDVFIGCNSIILMGVHVGNNVIIGAGSVVTKDIPGNSVVAGNPARVISSFDEYISKNAKNMNKSPIYEEDYVLFNHPSLDKLNEMSNELNSKNGYIR